MRADSGACFEVRKARAEDLTAAKKLAAENADALGFVLRSALAKAIAEDRMVVAEAGGRLIGFQEYYHRKRDGQTTLYHKCVSLPFRRRGVGTALVNTVVDESRREGRQFLLLKCPQGLPSNKFHESYGFRLVAVEGGRRRKLNVWRYDL
jgi:GNAT superfamily N-acetyltransferase